VSEFRRDRYRYGERLVYEAPDEHIGPASRRALRGSGMAEAHPLAADSAQLTAHTRLEATRVGPVELEPHNPRNWESSSVDSAYGASE
jgi:hypothetical protein